MSTEVFFFKKKKKGEKEDVKEECLFNSSPWESGGRFVLPID